MFLGACPCPRLTNFDVDDLLSNAACSLESCCVCAIGSGTGQQVVVRLAKAPTEKNAAREMPRLPANSTEFPVSPTFHLEARGDP